MAFYDYAGNEVTEFTETTDIEKKFKGKNVIWLGDSLIDYETPEGCLLYTSPSPRDPKIVIIGRRVVRHWRQLETQSMMPLTLRLWQKP